VRTLYTPLVGLDAYPDPVTRLEQRILPLVIRVPEEDAR
jgi:hypothetical protein